MIQCYFLGDDGIMHALTTAGGWVRYLDHLTDAAAEREAGKVEERERIYKQVHDDITSWRETRHPGLNTIMDRLRSSSSPQAQDAVSKDWTFDEARMLVNMDRPVLASLLYDLGLMPEQVVGDERRADMTLIIAHFEAVRAETIRELGPWLRHSPGCNTYNVSEFDSSDCTCGLWKAKGAPDA